MKRARTVHAGAAAIAMLVVAGLALGLTATPAMGQQQEEKKERRRRSADQPAKPVEFTQGQVSELTKLANDRKLSTEDVLAAAKTYLPSGRHDDYVIFASGGHSGQM